jgi:hypothetical protein
MRAHVRTLDRTANCRTPEEAARHGRLVTDARLQTIPVLTSDP